MTTQTASLGDQLVALASRRGISTVVAVVLGLVISGFVMLAVGYNPIETYGVMLTAAFGSANGWEETIRWTVPLIILGLSVAVSFRAGVFNIGAQGQFLVGAIAAAAVGLGIPEVPPVVAVPLSILAGIVAGMAWAFIPAVLRAFAGVNEVISTLLMTFLAVQFTGYLARGPLKNPTDTGQVLATATLDPSRRLAPAAFPLPGVAFVIAIAVLALVILYCGRTVWGYQDVMTGRNPYFAEYGSVRLEFVTIRVFLISGALAGLAGALDVLGPVGRFIGGFSADIGLTAVLVALAASNVPAAIAVSALFFGGLASASQQLRVLSEMPQSMILILQGVITILITAHLLLVRPRTRRPARGSAKAQAGPHRGRARAVLDE